MAQPVAVLVDGDNISGKHAAAILALAGTHGETTITRVYLDAQRAGDWASVVGYRLIHAGTGKNAADILLALDAMELALTKGVRQFVIASSDGDFTHLAMRLRECGAKVIGVGEAKAPATFRASVTGFVEVGAKPVVKLVVKPQVKLSELDTKIRDMIVTHGEDAKGVRLNVLASLMAKEHQVRLSALGSKNWRAYFLERPTLFDLDPRGPDAHVRLRPAAAIRAA
jgi:hypothetical protein